MINNKIQSGDFFKLNGFTYECVGTDDGLIWYEEPGKMDSVSADPQDCRLTHKYINHLLTPYRESAEEVLNTFLETKNPVIAKLRTNSGWNKDEVLEILRFASQFNQSLPLTKEEVEKEAKELYPDNPKIKRSSGSGSIPQREAYIKGRLMPQSLPVIKENETGTKPEEKANSLLNQEPGTTILDSIE